MTRLTLEMRVALLEGELAEMGKKVAGLEREVLALRGQGSELRNRLNHVEGEDPRNPAWRPTDRPLQGIE